MNKFFGIIAAAAIALAPMSASALEALNDSAMNDVTGQAGVSIALDDIVIYQTGVADTTYIDTDGLMSHALTGAASQVGNITQAGIMIDYVDNYQKLTIIDGIIDDTFHGGMYSAATLTGLFTGAPSVGMATGSSIVKDPLTGNTDNDDYRTGASPLTIDVGTCQSLTAGLNFNGGVTAAPNADVAGVIIGLPTIEIQTYYTTDIKDVKLAEVTGSAVNGTKEFIRIKKSGNSTMAILGGRIEIAPH